MLVQKYEKVAISSLSSTLLNFLSVFVPRYNEVDEGGCWTGSKFTKKIYVSFGNLWKNLHHTYCPTKTIFEAGDTKSYAYTFFLLCNLHEEFVILLHWLIGFHKPACHFPQMPCTNIYHHVKYFTFCAILASPRNCCPLFRSKMVEMTT